MDKEYRAKKDSKRLEAPFFGAPFFWSADIYVGMGFLKTLSAKGANGQGVSREEGL